MNSRDLPHELPLVSDPESGAVEVQATSGGAVPLLAMVALAHPVAVPAELFVAEFQRISGAAVDSNAVQQNDQTLVIPIAGGVAAVSLMDAPIPWGELAGPCAAAWWWPEAQQRLRPHLAHLLIAHVPQPGLPQKTPLERHILLSQLAATAITVCGGLGVYWCGGTLVYPPDEFCQKVRSLSDEALFPELWIDMRFAGNADGSVQFFTTGLAALELPELEIRSTRRTPRDVLDFCYGLILYMLTEGTQIAAGDTIGRTESERMTVAYGPSQHHAAGVMLLSDA